MADDAHRAGAHRPRRAPRPQVVGEPRPVVLRGLGATLGLDAVARDDAREPWQPRVDDAVGGDGRASTLTARQAHERALLGPVGRRDVADRGLPGPVPGRETGSRPGPCGRAAPSPIRSAEGRASRAGGTRA